MSSKRSEPGAPAPPESTASRASLGRLLADAGIWAFFLIGIALRCWSLPSQILGGDELHAVRAVRSLSFPELLYTYRLSDHSMALSSFYKVCLAAFGSLDWVGFRAIPVLSGDLLLVWGVLAIRKAWGTGTAAWWAALAALSPSLVFFSRIARPYGPALLAVSVCLFCFHSWWLRERSGLGGYLVFGSLAVWFHPLTLPFVALPLLFGLVDLRWRAALGEPRGRDLRCLIRAGVGLALGLATFLLPGAPSLTRLLRAKVGQERFSMDTLPSALALIAGTHDKWVALGFFALAFWGWFRWLRRKPRTGLFIASLLILPAMGIALLHPIGIADPKVLHRYLLPTVPLLLLCIASLAHAPTESARDRTPIGAPIARRAAVVSLLLASFATGPLATWQFLRSNLAHHGQYLLWHSQLPRDPDIAVPSVYRAARAYGGRVLEFPWFPEWRFSLAPLLYQRFHKQPIIVAIPIEQFNVDWIELPSSVPPEPQSMLASGARFVVVHLDMAAEEARARFALSMASLRYTENLAKLAEGYRHSGESLARQLRALLGPPHYEDAGVLGWDLEAPAATVKSNAASRRTE